MNKEELIKWINERIEDLDESRQKEIYLNWSELDREQLVEVLEMAIFDGLSNHMADLRYILDVVTNFTNTILGIVKTLPEKLAELIDITWDHVPKGNNAALAEEMISSIWKARRALQNGDIVEMTEAYEELSKYHKEDLE